MRILFSFALLAVSSILALGAVELALRVFSIKPISSPRPSSAPSLHQPCKKCEHLYELNPAHPEVSPQGLRDRVFNTPKPPKVKRILVLGDSVTFGVGVKPAQTFSKRLEAKLETSPVKVEVLNAGVSGYSTFNQAHLFEKLRPQFQPDWVVLAFCLNDVVDPLPHWHTSKAGEIRIPKEAIPNPQNHRSRQLTHQVRTRIASLAERFAVFALANRALVPRWERWLGRESSRFQTHQGKRWPVYLTLEDPLPITVLTHENSPEWQWLRKWVLKLEDSVTRSGAKFAVLILPLAYQLEKDYPFHPQKVWKRFCQKHKLDCVDPLAVLQTHGAQKSFLLERSGYHDVWHLSELGHEVIAEELFKLFVNGPNLPRFSRP